MVFLFKKNLRHAVSRTQQSRNREPSVKTLRSPVSAELLYIYIGLRVEWQNLSPRFASTPEKSKK